MVAREETNVDEQITPALYENDLNRKTTLDIDDLLEEAVGPAGLWQISCAILLALTSYPLSLFPVFANSSGSHRCLMEPSVEAVFVEHNVSFMDAARIIGPWPDDDESVRGGMGCLRYRRDWTDMSFSQLINSSINSNETELCPIGYIFQSSELTYPGNVVEEFGTVCDRSWLVPVGTSLYMLSMLLGFLLGGLCADRFGRKYTLLGATLLEGIFGFFIAAATNYTVYISIRMILGICNTARVSIGSILLMELTTAKHRSTLNTIHSVGINFVCRSMMALYAFLLPNWRHLHMALSFPCVFVMAYALLLPESPRWLYSKGRAREAILNLRKGVRMNRTCGDKSNRKSTRLDELLCSFELFPAKRNCVLPEQKKAWHVSNICKQLMANRNSYKRCFIAISYVSGVVMAFFGILLYARIIRGSVYLITFINAITALPAAFLSLVLYRCFTSRKYPLLACSVLTIVSLLTSSLYNILAKPSTDVVLTIGASFGLIMLNCCMNMSYVYIPELFPSEQRAYWFGIVLGISRLGSFFSTYINELDHYLQHGTPVAIFAAAMTISTAMSVLLTDTSGDHMPDFAIQVEDVESAGKEYNGQS